MSNKEASDVAAARELVLKEQKEKEEEEKAAMKKNVEEGRKFITDWTNAETEKGNAAFAKTKEDLAALKQKPEGENASETKEARDARDVQVRDSRERAGYEKKIKKFADELKAAKAKAAEEGVKEEDKEAAKKAVAELKTFQHTKPRFMAKKRASLRGNVWEYGNADPLLSYLLELGTAKDVEPKLTGASSADRWGLRVIFYAMAAIDASFTSRAIAASDLLIGDNEDLLSLLETVTGPAIALGMSVTGANNATMRKVAETMNSWTSDRVEATALAEVLARMTAAVPVEFRRAWEQMDFGNQVLEAKAKRKSGVRGLLDSLKAALDGLEDQGMQVRAAFPRLSTYAEKLATVPAADLELMGRRLNDPTLAELRTFCRKVQELAQRRGAQGAPKYAIEVAFSHSEEALVASFTLYLGSKTPDAAALVNALRQVMTGATAATMMEQKTFDEKIALLDNRAIAAPQKKRRIELQ